MLQRDPIVTVKLASDNEAALKSLKGALARFDSLKDCKVESQVVEGSQSPSINNGAEIAESMAKEMMKLNPGMGDDTLLVSYTLSFETNFNSETKAYPEGKEAFFRANIRFAAKRGQERTFKGRSLAIDLDTAFATNTDAIEFDLAANTQLFDEGFYNLLSKTKIDDRIAYYPDYPKPGVLFKEVSMATGDPLTFKLMGECVVHEIKARKLDKVITKVIGFETKGFIYGTMIAQAIGCGFVMLRKAGKLPGETVQVNYTTEYSEDRLELMRNSVNDDDHFLLVDDCIATGGTLDAGVRALDKIGTLEAALCVFKVEPLWEIAKAKLQPHEVIVVL